MGEGNFFIYKDDVLRGEFMNHVIIPNSLYFTDQAKTGFTRDGPTSIYAFVRFLDAFFSK